VNDLSPEPLGPLTKQLLDYWLHHPEAQSTIEAIVEWWLLEQRIRQTAAEVRFIVDRLVEKGFVIEQTQPDGRISYRLNREKEGEIRVWMASRGKRNPDRPAQVW
jgi:hypothetical protein